MKRSTRLIFRTIVATHVLLALSVAATRLFAVDVGPGANATSAAELAQLRDFTVVRAMGQFDVEIVQQANYSVEFIAGANSTAVFRAAIREEGVLGIYATNGPPGDRLRIGMPVLNQITVVNVGSLGISGFSGDTMVVRNDGSGPLELRNNAIAQWNIATGSPLEVKFDQTSFADSKVQMNGQGTISLLE